MKKTIKLILITTLALFQSNILFAEEKSNVSIKKEKYEIALVDGKEIRFKTSTLKPIITFEEQIEITNISDRTIKFVIYDFEPDKKTFLYQPIESTDRIDVKYSHNNGETFSSFPIVENKNQIPIEEYTNIKITINKLEPKETETLFIRYKYDHFLEQ